MAEAICRRLLAEKLKCDDEELDDRGVMVMSAGIAAMPGGRPTLEAVEVMAKSGLGLDGHVAQPLSYRLASQSDFVFTMTNGHRHAILQQWPELSDRVHVLHTGGRDISDPIGGSLEVYQSCAKQIEQELKHRIDELHLDTWSMTSSSTCAPNNAPPEASP